MDTFQLVCAIQETGATIRAENSKLKVRQDYLLSDELRSWIRQLKPQLLNFLEHGVIEEEVMTAAVYQAYASWVNQNFPPDCQPRLEMLPALSRFVLSCTRFGKYLDINRVRSVRPVVDEVEGRALDLLELRAWACCNRYRIDLAVEDLPNRFDARQPDYLIGPLPPFPEEVAAATINSFLTHLETNDELLFHSLGEEARTQHCVCLIQIARGAPIPAPWINWGNPTQAILCQSLESFH